MSMTKLQATLKEWIQAWKGSACRTYQEVAEQLQKQLFPNAHLHESGKLLQGFALVATCIPDPTYLDHHISNLLECMQHDQNHSWMSDWDI
jgi:hypothetical protein